MSRLVREMRQSFGIAVEEFPPVTLRNFTFRFNLASPDDLLWAGGVARRLHSKSGPDIVLAHTQQLLTLTAVCEITMNGEPFVPWAEFLTDDDKTALAKHLPNEASKYAPSIEIRQRTALRMADVFNREFGSGFMEELTEHFASVVDPNSYSVELSRYSCPVCGWHYVFETRELPYFCRECGGFKVPDPTPEQEAASDADADAQSIELTSGGIVFPPIPERLPMAKVGVVRKARADSNPFARTTQR